MSLSSIYDRLINWPGPIGLIVALCAAIVLMVLSAILLARDKHRQFARGLGIVGVVVFMVVLWMVHEQTISERQGPHVTLVQYTYPWRLRLPVRVALVCLPAAAIFVMSSVFRSTQRWLRARVPRLLKTGRRHSFRKEYAAALREYNQAIDSAPDLAEGYFRRGALYHSMGEMTFALADYERALARDPRLAAPYLQRAKIRTEIGDYDSALADFAKFMSLRQNDPESFLHRGICLMKKGMRSDAIVDFQRVLKLTNHSDYSDPARNYLRICQSELNPSVPLASANGSPALPESSQPRAHDVNR
jgi:tetratricopeptide (TPR) repeat protein